MPSGTALTDVAVAADGTVWYTNELKKTIGRFVPTDATYAEFRLADIDPALASGTPRALRAAPDGSLWAVVSGGFSSPGANAILRIVPAVSPTVTTYKLGAASQPLEAAPAPNGDVYFTGSAASRRRTARPADGERRPSRRRRRRPRRPPRPRAM